MDMQQAQQNCEQIGNLTNIIKRVLQSKHDLVQLIQALVTTKLVQLSCCTHQWIVLRHIINTSIISQQNKSHIYQEIEYSNVLKIPCSEQLACNVEVKNKDLINPSNIFTQEITNDQIPRETTRYEDSEPPCFFGQRNSQSQSFRTWNKSFIILRGKWCKSSYKLSQFHV